MTDKEAVEIVYYRKRIAELEMTVVTLRNFRNEQATCIERLEKENAELKEQNRKLLESCEGATMMYEHLTKAKVVLRNVIDYLGQFCSDYPDCVIEAELFLKDSEVEK